MTLCRWNNLSTEEAARAILPCCGSKTWAQAMAARRPIPDKDALLESSNDIWRSLARSDWMEAFASHPRIGDSPAAQSASAQSAVWSTQEQRNIADAGEAVKNALANANREYEQRFNHIFIICATDKSAPEILEILQRRLKNDDETEFQEAAEQQRQITELRLKKWLQP